MNILIKLIILMECAVYYSSAASNNCEDSGDRIYLSYDDCNAEAEKYELKPIAVYFAAENESIWGCFEDEKEFLSEMKGVTNLKFIDGRESHRLCLGLVPRVAGKPQLSKDALHYECFYGSRKRPTSLMVGNNLCIIPCMKDDTAFCNGAYRIKVYRVDVNGIPVVEEVTEKPELCIDSPTTVNGKSACKGSVIFKEDFNSLNTQRWFHSNYIPWNPDYEFVFFSDDVENSFVNDGKLFIKPKLMSDWFVRQGVIEYKNCSGREEVECRRKAESFSIIPPIRSARISTNNSFSFKYGRVDIRAKLPGGDWIYPELLLHPKDDKIENKLKVETIIIANSKGNRELTHQGSSIGGTLLQSGVCIGLADEIKTKFVQKSSLELWSGQFHTYSVIWSPDNIIFMVDDKVIDKMIPDNSENLYDAMGIEAPDKSSDAKVAPFDQECILSLGLSVGGIRQFPDNSLSGSYQKPWMNKNTKAMFKFYTSKRLWAKTWSDADSNLQIDSIKITAI